MIKDDYGDKSSKIWLIGDSPPDSWKDSLRYPLDPHHPAVHNIWTPILLKINDYLYPYGKRLTYDLMYVRNAVNDSSHWALKDEERESYSRLKEEILKYEPTVIITFGVRACIMVWQSLNEGNGIPIVKPPHIKTGTAHSYSLGAIFRESIDSFNAQQVNLLPLLHTSVSRGYFLEGQADFCDFDREEYKTSKVLEDYFTYAGSRIGVELHQKGII